jgi:predicted Zn-dependent protease
MMLLKATLAQQHRDIEAVRAAERRQTPSAPEAEWLAEEENPGFQSPDEQFRALCGMLPDPVRRAYLGYGADFKTGYLALNNGDFETAARYLTRALETRNAADSYIPLELATACLQLNRPEQARQLLETLLDHHPDALPAYQILCEIYWEQGAFDRADALLASIPGELAASLAVFLLKGETLFQAGHLDVAKTFYRDFLATYGWDESIAGALARTHEALNEMDQALRMYQEIMGHCSGCHRRVDPRVKEKVADLSFAAGMHDTAILGTLSRPGPGTARERLPGIMPRSGGFTKALATRPRPGDSRRWPTEWFPDRDAMATYQRVTSASIKAA